MSIGFDLKYAWRLMFKSPGHSLLCVVVVALSVTLAQFSHELAYSQMFEPLPFAGSGRWTSIHLAANATARYAPTIDAYTYQELVEHSRTTKHLGAFYSRPAVLSEANASVGLRAVEISPALFAAFHVTPVVGRLFDAEAGRTGATPVVVLSYDIWQNYFSGDPAIAGKQARIDGRPVEVLGVLPEDFFVFQDFGLWMPLELPKLTRPADSTRVFSAIAVLDPGQSEDAIAAELGPVVEEINRRYPETFNSGRHIAMIPANRLYSQNNLEVVAMISFIAVAVLVLGAVNISLIFLARLLERSRELALRTALGSSRSRLFRQCLLESSLLVALGLGIAFVLVSLWLRWAHWLADYSGRILAAGRTANVPELRGIDVLAATIAAIALWLLSTLIPAWVIAKQDAAAVLGGSGKGVAAGGTKSAGLLVGLQVTLSCLVLVICTNLAFSVYDEMSRPNHMKTRQVMMSVYPTVFDARYPGLTERLRYWDELSAAITAKSSGAELAYASAPPSRPINTPIAVEHQEGTAQQGTIMLPISAVSDGYFPLLGIEARTGRLFDQTDTEASLSVAVIDEYAARKYWPNEGAIGKRIQLNPTDNGPWLTVVGVVSPVGGRPYRRDAGVLYRPLRQASVDSFIVLARLPLAPPESRTLLHAAAFAVDRDLPLHNIQTLEEYLAAMNISYASLVPVFIILALITVVLAATGLFGLISRSVARRTQEIGVRRALGGTRWQVTGIFLRQGAIYSSLGVIGCGLGIFVTNLMSGSVPNVMAYVVPVTFLVLVVMASVIFVSSYLPTRRAVALEPGDALRYE